MNKVREIIRLKRESKLSVRRIARALNISRPAGSEYLSKFSASGLTYQDVKKMSDTELMQVFGRGATKKKRYDILSCEFEYFTKELKRTGVTLQQLWEEYKLRLCSILLLLSPVAKIFKCVYAYNS